MPEAIASNYKGIIEAIKEKSGNGDLSYPSNFYGIVNALVDAIGFDAPAGNGVIPLPPGSELPGSGIDGDLVVMPNADGNYFLYVRVDDKWHRIHVTTQEVETAGSAPAARRTRVINRYKPIAKKNRLGDPGALTNQQDINHYLFNELESADNATKDELEEVWDAIDALPVTVAEKGPEDADEGDLWFDSKEYGLQLFVFYGGEWIVASPPVASDDVEDAIFQLQRSLKLTIQTVEEHQNRLDGFIAFSPEPPTIYPDEVYEDGYVAQSELNSKFWVNTDTDQLHILRKTEDGYEYQPVIGGGGADIYYGDFEPQQEYSFWYDTNRLELFVSYEGMWFPASPGAGGGGGGGITEEELAPLLQPYARLDGADFTAKVTVEPGTQGNEVVTFQQLQEIEEEIEDIRPTQKR